MTREQAEIMIDEFHGYAVRFACRAQLAEGAAFISAAGFYRGLALNAVRHIRDLRRRYVYPRTRLGEG